MPWNPTWINVSTCEPGRRLNGRMNRKRKRNNIFQTPEVVTDPKSSVAKVYDVTYHKVVRWLAMHAYTGQRGDRNPLETIPECLSRLRLVYFAVINTRSRGLSPFFTVVSQQRFLLRHLPAKREDSPWRHRTWRRVHIAIVGCPSAFQRNYRFVAA